MISQPQKIDPISRGKDLKKSLLKLPTTPGVYLFLAQTKRSAKAGLDDEGDILYIGKATNLKDRVKSYFSKDLIQSRGPLLVDMLFYANKVDFIKTDTVLEALILEARLIKKHQPKYNTKEKDNKSFNYVCITKEVLPKVIVERGRVIDFIKLKAKSQKLKAVYGPFPNGSQLRDALKILRRFFPFFDNNSNKKQNYQFYKQLSLIPSNDYKKNLNNLILFFEGKKTKIITNLEKEMLGYAKKKEFEKAEEIKRKIFALNHINDITLIKSENLQPTTYNLKPFRIEAYDIAHLSGSNMVGAYSVIDQGEKETSQYRTFNIKGFTASNDAGALGEVIARRLNHPEWQIPDLIIADGNQIQKNVIEKELKKRNLKIPVIAVVKDSRHKAKAMIGDVDIIKKYKKEILLANAEVHRFVLNRHKIKRSNTFLKNG